MKNPKTLWWWQWLCLLNNNVSTRCPDKRLHLVRVQVKNRSQKQNWITIHWHMVGADCCLIGIVLGVRTTKNCPKQQYYPIPANIAQYPITQYRYRSNANNSISNTCTVLHFSLNLLLTFGTVYLLMKTILQSSLTGIIRHANRMEFRCNLLVSFNAVLPFIF